MSTKIIQVVPETHVEDINQCFSRNHPTIREYLPDLAARNIPGLNIIQTAVLAHAAEDCNVIISSPTSSGKTIMAEILMKDALEQRRLCIYLSPLKAVSQEKYDDWTDPAHHFSNYKVEILTGDYQLSNEKRGQLEQADIVVMTSEMLDSKVRIYGGDNSQWLKRSAGGVLVVDEAHLLTFEGRGGALECGILRYAQVFPDSRIIFLSATMGNVEQLARWLWRLNNKETVIINSQYQPVPLTKTVVGASEPIRSAISLINQYPDDCFLIFSHTKKMGNNVLETLERMGVPARFHNADLERKDRLEIEQQFRQKKLRVLISTSTTAFGLNLPARRVCILGTKRGPQTVDAITLLQMMGRAGRLGLDTVGDAYLLVDPFEIERWRQEIKKPLLVTSTINNTWELASHIVAEISHGVIYDTDSCLEWAQHTLAGEQQLIDNRLVEDTLKEMLLRRVLKQDAEGHYKLTFLGRVALLFYFHPFDISALVSGLKTLRNLYDINKAGFADNDDAQVAMISASFSSLPSFKEMWMTSPEKGETLSLLLRPYQTWLPNKQMAELLYLFAKEKISRKQAMAVYPFTKDLDRWEAAINMLSQAYPSPNSNEDWFKTVLLRIAYGVSSEKAQLCRIKGVGRERANKIFSYGITSIQNLLSKKRLLSQMFSDKLAKQIMIAARELVQ